MLRERTGSIVTAERFVLHFRYGCDSLSADRKPVA
jgi:hypothetical protein